VCDTCVSSGYPFFKYPTNLIGYPLIRNGTVFGGQVKIGIINLKIKFFIFFHFQFSKSTSQIAKLECQMLI